MRNSVVLSKINNIDDIETSLVTSGSIDGVAHASESLMLFYKNELVPELHNFILETRGPIMHAL